MKLYCGKNRKGTYKASIDESKVEKFSDVFECDVPVIHNNKVYMIRTYHGFYYNDVVTHSRLFHSVMSAKKSGIWQEKEKLSKEKPEEYHVTPFSIASDDYGEPFTYGDSFIGKFNMKVIGVRVI